MAGIDRRLVRSSAAARTHLRVVGALAALSAVLVVAQAVLLAGVIARGAFGGASLAELRGKIVLLLAVTVVRGLVSAGFQLAGNVGASAVMRELRVRLARRLLVERPGRRADERTGELAAGAVQGVDALDAYFSGYLPQVALAAVVPVAVLAYSVRLDVAAAAILAVTVPVLIGFMILIGLSARARAASRWRALTLLSAHFLDVVRGLPALRAHNRDRAQAERIAAVGDEYRRETMGTLRIAFLSALVLELCAMLGTAIAAAAIGIALAEGQLELEAGLTVLILAPEMYAPLRAVGQQFHAAADGTAAAERLLDVLDEPLAVTAPASPVPAPDPSVAAVRLEAVRFSYPGRDGEVLRGADLELRPGEVTAVVGPSGAGKTTLAALVLRLADPDSGRVMCGGIDIRETDPEAWHRNVAWVPQQSRLFAGTVADNIRLADPDADESRVRNAAANAGALGVVASLPEGLTTRVGEGGRRLSAGQTRRIALARAFLADRPLMVLDEPTSHLDRAAARDVADAVVRLARGRTTLLITHDLELAARADRVVELVDGLVVAASPRVEVAA